MSWRIDVQDGVGRGDLSFTIADQDALGGAIGCGVLADPRDVLVAGDHPKVLVLVMGDGAGAAEVAKLIIGLALPEQRIMDVRCLHRSPSCPYLCASCGIVYGKEISGHCPPDRHGESAVFQCNSRDGSARSRGLRAPRPPAAIDICRNRV